MNAHSQQRIRVAAIETRGSCCDGPGVRAIVFMQGCDRTVKCPGCQNPSSHSMSGGTLMTVGDVVSRLVKSPLRRVTISGGEPLAQREALRELLKALKSKGFDIALYTWREAEQVPADILANADWLKTGPFVNALKTATTPFVGSKNQVFMKVA